MTTLNLKVSKHLQVAAQHALQLTPLARPETRRVFHACRVPSTVAFKEAASGAIEAHVGPPSARNTDAGRSTPMFPSAGHEPARTDHHSWVAERGKTGDP